jgi:DNA polymerase III sliding clamp (beta) subunit (PCNA family)
MILETFFGTRRPREEVPPRSDAVLAAADLAEVLRFARHTADAGPARGVKIEVARNRLRAVGTDGHRLALAECSAAGELDAVLLPITARELVVQAARGGSVALRRKGGHLYAAIDGKVHPHVLGTDDFHAYRQVLPAFHRSVPFVEVDIRPLAAALKSAGRLLKNDNLHLVVHPSGTFTVQGHEVPVERGNGLTADIPFQPAYVRDAIAAFSASDVRWLRLELHGADRPLLMEPAATDTRYGARCVLIMPRRGGTKPDEVRGRLPSRRAR